jgi:hypothetical protein
MTKKPIGFVKSSLNLSTPTLVSFFPINLYRRWLKYLDNNFLKIKAIINVDKKKRYSFIELSKKMVSRIRSVRLY